MSWNGVPKVELHLHLEGAAPPDFIRALAREKKADISGIFDERGNYAYADFAEFLKVYEAATSVLTTPEDYARLTRVVLENCAAHEVIYAEAFLSPDFCGGGDVKAWWEYCAAMAEVAEGAQKDLGITLKGIITCIRHFGPEAARAPALCAAESAGEFITGFGMGGAETVGKPGDYAWAFDCAREAGLRLTAHAGEWGGPEMVRDTLDQLGGIERIGHGVGAALDGALMERLAREQITLEVCPGSNIALGLFRHWHDHPIEKLRENGVAVTVSTDDPPFFHTTMTREYQKLNEVFGWDEGDFAALNENAMAAAFCDAATREDILKRLKT